MKLPCRAYHEEITPGLWPGREVRFRVTGDEDHHAQARDVLEDVEPDLKQFLRDHAQQLTDGLRAQLDDDGVHARRQEGVHARRQEEERYRSRQGEISSLIAENTMAKLEREIEKLKADRQQGQLFDESERLEKIDRSIDEKKEEIGRRTRHYEEVREQLEKERKRVLGHLLTNRHTMSGEAQAFPVCVEVRLPMGAR